MDYFLIQADNHGIPITWFVLADEGNGAVGKDVLRLS